MIDGEELEQEDQIANNAITTKTKKEWQLKAHMRLSTRRKIERLWKIKHCIAKTANLPEEKNECAD